ncbi:MAG: hypothetical protein IPH04_20500 [Saprospirales bacterium]|nr:hypothetical protein [Saprospirales bacterium]
MLAFLPPFFISLLLLSMSFFYLFDFAVRGAHSKGWDWFESRGNNQKGFRDKANVRAKADKNPEKFIDRLEDGIVK